MGTSEFAPSSIQLRPSRCATVIGKPFSIDELSDTVRDLVGREGSSLG